MNQKNIKELIMLANEFDEKGLTKEANIIDRIIRFAEGIQWHQHENMLSAFFHGYELTISTEENGSYSWIVEATNKISEYPEVYKTGESKTIEQAKKDVELSVKKAIKDDKR